MSCRQSSHCLRQVFAGIQPDAIAHSLKLKDRRHRRPDDFHQHAHVPVTAPPEFHIRRIARRGMKAGLCQHNHAVLKGGDQRLRMRVVPVGGGGIPASHQLPLIQNEAEIAAHDPAMIGVTFLAGLFGKVGHRMIDAVE